MITRFDRIHERDRLTPVLELGKKQGDGRAPKARGAVGANGCGVWERGLGRGNPPSPENFIVFGLEMVSFGAFWVVFIYLCHYLLGFLKTRHITL